MDLTGLTTLIFDGVDDGDVERAARASLRLARHIGDHMNTAILLHELVDDRREIIRILFDDAQHLSKEAHRYLYERSLKRWIDSRTLPFAISTSDDGEERNVLSSPVGEFSSEIEQCEKLIADLKIPSTMGAFDSAAFTDRYDHVRRAIRLKIKAVHTVRSRVLTYCHNFAVQVELQFQNQKKTRTFLEQAQGYVQNFFKAKSADVYEKLEKANALVFSDSREDLSLLLTQVRRAIKSVADHFYPPSAVAIQCSDGVERTLGDDQYLNRLQEFVYASLPRSTSNDLLRAELEYLVVGVSEFLCVRRIAELAVG
jgi:hypothetical protein